MSMKRNKLHNESDVNDVSLMWDDEIKYDDGVVGAVEEIIRKINQL